MKRILTIALLATALTPAIALAETSAGASAYSQQSIQGRALSRADVIEIQQALNERGFYQGRADGVWGPNTATALQRFQQQNQLDAQGNIDSTTLNELGVTLSMNQQTSAGTESQFDNRASRRGTSVNTGADVDAQSNLDSSAGSTSSSMGSDTSGDTSNTTSTGVGINADVGADVGVGVGGTAGND
jgi:peptidoglycan hydrolase-like protein with peptidoglycan-binding domain